MTGNCPLLSKLEEERAPWNQEDKEPKKITVTVSMTLSKDVEVEVTDYIAKNEVDEDNNDTVNYDFSECDLKKAVENQITLPSEAYNKLHHAIYLTKDWQAKDSIEDLKDWCVDDFTVIENI